MADIPKERLDGSLAFEITGVDFCGPFFYKPEARNKAPIKCYVCAFIFFATKAVHLELIKDLSTVSFLHGLKRFICTRRRPRQIWSDNATNFVGARKDLLDLKRLFLSDDHQKAVLGLCLWEAAVKTAEYHFYRAIATSVLEFEELRTLLCHITAVINSRPLVSISENPADLDVLTPAYFLNGGPLASFAEPDVTQLNFDRLNGWQRVSYLQQIFWSRWKEEYIISLQQRSKWRTPKPSLAVADVVLVKVENLPPMKWPLARVDARLKNSSLDFYGRHPIILPAVIRLLLQSFLTFTNGICTLDLELCLD
ncbi:uncharacterized protein LOC121405350 [Drosophila obscura]|uniref:uncharacterized protein LOC121405350 n=1 Tax=Drosophila obscura TaxID=7282 RepID=UPI001BB1EF2B|nr:uncharacterized protein LOC121405350 [Drosophila obscura]